MLKTNSRAARQNVRQYIMNHSEYLTEVYEATTEKQILAGIAQAYKDEYQTAQAPMTQKHFTEWASGLTCGDLFDYYLHSAVDALGDILQESEEERSKYTEEQAERTLSYLIYREVERNS